MGKIPEESKDERGHSPPPPLEGETVAFACQFFQSTLLLLVLGA